MCNNTKENFLREPEKINAKLHKKASFDKIFRILTVFSQFFQNLTFIFSGFHKKFSLVLLHLTNYIHGAMDSEVKICGVDKDGRYKGRKRKICMSCRRREIVFKVDRLQIILVAKKYTSTCRNCSSVGCLKCVQFRNWFRLH